MMKFIDIMTVDITCKCRYKMRKKEKKENINVPENTKETELC